MENFNKFPFPETFKLLSISVLRILCACVRFSLVVCVPWQGVGMKIAATPMYRALRRFWGYYFDTIETG